MSDNETNTEAVDENKLIHQRREKLQEIRQQGNAFPNDFRRTAFANELHAEFDEQSKEAITKANRIVSVVGRVIRMRGPFIVLLDGSGEIQLYINFKNLDEVKNKEIKSENSMNFMLGLMFDEEGPMRELLDPFISTPIGLEALNDIRRGYTKNGKRIWGDLDTDEQKMIELPMT